MIKSTLKKITKTYKKRSACETVAVALLISTSFCANVAIAQKVESPRATNEANNTTQNGIVILSEKIGLMAREIISLGASRMTEKRLLNSPEAALGYIEADEFDISNKENVDNIKFLVSIGMPLLIESDTWNASIVKSRVEQLFPGTETKNLTSHTVIIRGFGTVLSAEDVGHTTAQLMAGIPLEGTTEANVRKEFNDFRGPMAKSGGHWTLRFAEKAYDQTPSDHQFILARNGSVVDIWVSKDDREFCVVAWRGTNITSLSDISADFSAQLHGLIDIPYIYSSGSFGGKGGEGFVNRYRSQIEDVDATLSNRGCRDINITGHSLGGAVGMIHSMHVQYLSSQNLSTLTVYNPARAVDQKAWDSFHNYVLDRPDSPHRVYCRTGDPVNPVPTGLLKLGPLGNPNYGCTYWGGLRFTVVPWGQHTLSFWHQDS